MTDDTMHLETLEKIGILFGYMSEGLRRYGRFSIELAARAVMVCIFDTPKHRTTFEIQLSEINSFRHNQILDLTNILIERHLQNIIQAIEAESLPDTTGTRLSPADL